MLVKEEDEEEDTEMFPAVIENDEHDNNSEKGNKTILDIDKNSKKSQYFALHCYFSLPIQCQHIFQLLL